MKFSQNSKGRQFSDYMRPYSYQSKRDYLSQGHHFNLDHSKSIIISDN